MCEWEYENLCGGIMNGKSALFFFRSPVLLSAVVRGTAACCVCKRMWCKTVLRLFNGVSLGGEPLRCGYVPPPRASVAMRRDLMPSVSILAIASIENIPRRAANAIFEDCAKWKWRWRRSERTARIDSAQRIDSPFAERAIVIKRRSVCARMCAANCN